jgi:hypothetical protein
VWDASHRKNDNVRRFNCSVRLQHRVTQLRLHVTVFCEERQHTNAVFQMVLTVGQRYFFQRKISIAYDSVVAFSEFVLKAFEARELTTLGKKITVAEE